MLRGNDMSRVYIQPSWVGACEGWSGDSPDNRKCKSTQLFLPNGMANTAIFADDYVETNETTSSPKLSYKHPECVLPGEEFIDLLDQLELVTYKMYKEGMISKEQWLEEKADIQTMRDKEYDRYLNSQLRKK